MQTRGKDGIRKLKVFFVTVQEPSTVEEALQQDNWKQAMTDEYLALMRNHTWSLVQLPAGRKVIGCKWAFRIKENPDGTIQKYKARLVVKGFHQVAGFDFQSSSQTNYNPSSSYYCSK